MTKESKEPKALYRSRDNRWLAGVCGGLGDYFNLDPNLIRALFILFALVIGGGLILYVLLWVVIPPESIEEAIEEVLEAADTPPMED